MIFRSRKLNIDNSFKFKLDSKRLVPTKSAKYIGVVLDKQVHWNEHISQVKMKLDRAIGILSKLKYNANLSVLKIIYHSLFGSHLLYEPQLYLFKHYKTMPLKKLPLKNSKILLHVSRKILKF